MAGDLPGFPVLRALQGGEGDRVAGVYHSRSVRPGTPDALTERKIARRAGDALEDRGMPNAGKAVKGVTRTVGKVAGGAGNMAGKAVGTVGDAVGGVIGAVGDALPFGDDKGKSKSPRSGTGSRKAKSGTAKTTTRKTASKSGGAKASTTKATTVKATTVKATTTKAAAKPRAKRAAKSS